MLECNTFFEEEDKKMATGQVRGTVTNIADYMPVERRICPRHKSDIIPHKRVRILFYEPDGYFVRVMARLLPGESLCWRCGTPHKIAADVPGVRCPTCGKDFNGSTGSN